MVILFVNVLLGDDVVHSFHVIAANILYHCMYVWIWVRILVQVKIYRRLLIGRDGHIDQSEAYDIYRKYGPCNWPT